MPDRFASLRDATSAAILKSAGATSTRLRDLLVTGAAPPELASLVEKIRERAYEISDEDVAELRKTFSDEQLFEIIVVTTYGKALDQLRAAQKALDLA